MSDISKDPSIENEPHLKNASFQLDESEVKADRVFAGKKITKDQAVEHSVWDEPALSGELLSEPEGELTYSKWLADKLHTVSAAKSWAFCFLMMAASAPLAIIGVFFLSIQGNGALGGTAFIVFGPVIEELMKIAFVLITVEKRPYLFISQYQILLCCFFAGLIFSCIENLLYLYIYVPNPTLVLIIWRWSVCVFIHTSCTSISSMGLMEIWSKTTKELQKPDLSIMTKYVAIACIIHGVYNLIALILNPFFK